MDSLFDVSFAHNWYINVEKHVFIDRRAQISCRVITSLITLVGCQRLSGLDRLTTR